MKRKLLSLLMLVIGLSLTGCGKSKDAAKTDDKKTETTPKKEDGHDEHGEGPHGGTILELSKYHGELVVDHDKKTTTVYILDGKVKNAVPISAPKLQLSIKMPQFQADLMAMPQEGDPKGKSSRFVATHDHFAKMQEFEGTVSVEIDGKPYLSDFKEDHKDHKHDKK